MARIWIFYQIFHPDENVSSVHFSELAAGLAERGWEVTAFPGKRNLENASIQYAATDAWRGVTIARIWRPRLNRASGVGRIINALYMLTRWSMLALRFRGPDVIIVGTDPILSILVAPIWRLLRPGTQIVHWCFDLYPEAAYADGLLKDNSLFGRIIYKLASIGYRSCSTVVDIGSCMRMKLNLHGNNWKMRTLVPWALSEPEAPLSMPLQARQAIFGSAKLAIMYSGTFGRAHSFEDLVQLMDCLGDESACLALSVKGQRVASLRQAMDQLANVVWVPFASREQLSERLALADIHIVSLRPEWTGTVVPSKFFGAIAAGRPVLFCGSSKSTVAKWITQYGLGWVLEPGGATDIARELATYAQESNCSIALRERCFRVYQNHFSQRVVLDGWHEELLARIEYVTTV